MVVEGENLKAQDYEHLLPDHWILPQNNIWTKLHNYYVQRVVELVVQSGVKRVLEVGCGDGWNCGKLVKAGLDVVGIDWSRNGIEHAKRMVPNAHFMCCDLTASEFTTAFPEPFEAIIFVEVIEHIPTKDCVSALQKITKTLKPGGLFILTTPSVNLPNNNPQHYRHFDEQTLRNLISEAGQLIIDRIEGYGDVALEKRHYSIARWVNNKYYTIHPLLKWLQEKYALRISTPTALDICSGFIVSMRKIK